jgi:hypothetical protein
LEHAWLEEGQWVLLAWLLLLLLDLLLLLFAEQLSPFCCCCGALSNRCLRTTMPKSQVVRDVRVCV